MRKISVKFSCFMLEVSSLLSYGTFISLVKKNVLSFKSRFFLKTVLARNEGSLGEKRLFFSDSP